MKSLIKSAISSMNKVEPTSANDNKISAEDLSADSPMTDFSIGQAAMVSCLLEASAPKVGNVHRSADFDDTTFYDFVLSAVAIEKVFDSARTLSLGKLILESVRATTACVGTNTNLGMILLLAPLAQSSDLNVRSVKTVLSNSCSDDRSQLYDAIALAKPGGLGSVEDADVQQHREESDDYSLVEVMSLAAERDTIAKQYSNGFREFFDFVFPATRDSIQQTKALPDAIVVAHLRIMAEIPDTLIARKCGMDLAIQSAARAGKILHDYEAGTPDFFAALHDFDFWLRGDGNRRNPGTSADLVAAGLFACLRSGVLCRESIRTGLKAARYVCREETSG